MVSLAKRPSYETLARAHTHARTHTRARARTHAHTHTHLWVVMKGPIGTHTINGLDIILYIVEQFIGIPQTSCVLRAQGRDSFSSLGYPAP